MGSSNEQCPSRPATCRSSGFDHRLVAGFGRFDTRHDGEPGMGGQRVLDAAKISKAGAVGRAGPAGESRLPATFQPERCHSPQVWRPPRHLQQRQRVEAARHGQRTGPRLCVGPVTTFAGSLAVPIEAIHRHLPAKATGRAGPHCLRRGTLTLVKWHKGGRPAARPSHSRGGAARCGGGSGGASRCPALLPSLHANHAKAGEEEPDCGREGNGRNGAGLHG